MKAIQAGSNTTTVAAETLPISKYEQAKGWPQEVYDGSEGNAIHLRMEEWAGTIESRWYMRSRMMSISWLMLSFADTVFTRILVLIAIKSLEESTILSGRCSRLSVRTSNTHCKQRPRVIFEGVWKMIHSRCQVKHWKKITSWLLSFVDYASTLYISFFSWEFSTSIRQHTSALRQDIEFKL